jgi:hypothetical protein
MSVANLTRYTEFLRYDGHTSAALMVESSTGAYVKFEEAKVASSNSVQQLKAEIAAICIELDCCMFEKFTKEMYVELRRRLRQLSTVQQPQVDITADDELNDSIHCQPVTTVTTGGTQPTPDNTGSPKLPQFWKQWQTLAVPDATYGIDEVREVCERFYDLILRQLREGA